jgi:hypothetical protein
MQIVLRDGDRELYLDLMRSDSCIVWFEGKDAPIAAMVDTWGGDGEGVPD